MVPSSATLPIVDGVTDRLEAQLRDMVDQMAAGDPLPSERALMAEHGVCRSTARVALARLVAQRVVRPEHGRGYFVAPRRSWRVGRRSSSVAR